MINEQELRLGNWITSNSFNAPLLVTELPLAHGGDPIKITAENSEGFNLTKLKNIISLLQIVRSAPLVVPQEFYLVMELQSKAALKIEYVHQLQNLYLDITGEYLEWTPEKKRSKLTVI